VGAVELAVDLPRVYEQHRVRARRARLAAVEEPQRTGQRDGAEKVGSDRHHHVDGAGLDQLAAQF